MNSKLANEMLEKVRESNNPDHEPTVKLDKETVRIVAKWKLDNLRVTVGWLCRIADEVLTEASKPQKSDSTTA